MTLNDAIISQLVCPLAHHIAGLQPLTCRTKFILSLYTLEWKGISGVCYILTQWQIQRYPRIDTHFIEGTTHQYYQQRWSNECPYQPRLHVKPTSAQQCRLTMIWPKTKIIFLTCAAEKRIF